MNERARQYGVVPSEVMHSYDGLSFLKAIIDRRVTNSPIWELRGFHLGEPGRAAFEGLPEVRHYTPIGTAHGGFAAAAAARLGARLRNLLRAEQRRRLDHARAEVNQCVRSQRSPDRYARKTASYIAPARRRARSAISRTARAGFTPTPPPPA